jgi:hypothetical protein
LTVDQATTRLMEAARIPGERERREAFRKITEQVRRLAYKEGGDDAEDYWGDGMGY